jgi:hypothetical protein
MQGRGEPDGAQPPDDEPPSSEKERKELIEQFESMATMSIQGKKKASGFEEYHGIAMIESSPDTHGRWAGCCETVFFNIAFTIPGSCHFGAYARRGAHPIHNHRRTRLHHHVACHASRAEHSQLMQQELMGMPEPLPAAPPVPMWHADYKHFLDGKRLTYIRTRQHLEILE